MLQLHLKFYLMLSLLLWSGSATIAKAHELKPLVQKSTGARSGAKAEKDLTSLEQGKAIEREMAGGESHSYQLTLSSGQYLHAVVDQRGIDVVVSLFGPDSKQLSEIDSPNGTQGPEPLSWVAKVDGEYRLEVRSPDKEAAGGHYEVRIEELRMATAQDSSRVAAERASAEATKLRVESQGVAELLRKAIEKYEEALTNYRAAGDRVGEASTLNNIGEIYSLSQLRENQKALDYLNKALPIWRAIGDRTGEAISLDDIGQVYYNLSEYQKALDYYGQALPIRRAVGDRIGESKTLVNIGNAYSDSGDAQKALDYFNQALPFWRTVNDKGNEANTLNSIGATYRDLGYYQKALDYYGQALPLWRAVADLDGEALTLDQIGTVYTYLGENQRAIDYYGQALLLWQNVGNNEGAARTLNNIGDAYRRLSDYQRAIYYYNQSLPLYRAVYNRRDEAIILNNIARAYSDLGNGQKSLDYYNRALPIIRAVGYRDAEAYILTGIGRVYANLGERQKALDYYTQALPLRQAVGDQAGESATLYCIARVERDLGNLTEARKNIEDALKIVESIRANIASQELRASYFATVQEYYEFYIDLLMQMHELNPSTGEDANALWASERARARSLLELLTEARVDIRQGVDPELVEQERNLRQQLNVKAEQLLRLKSSEHREEQISATEKEIKELTTEFQEVEAQIRVKSPRYAALTQPQPLKLKEIQEQVLDDDTLLLEYSLGNKRSYLWLVSPTSIKSFTLPKRAVIEAAARRVYKLLNARNHIYKTKRERQARIAEADSKFLKAAALLSQMTLGPVAGELEKKRLLVIGEGALQYVPFGALPVPTADGRDRTANERRSKFTRPPLLVEHEIVSLPSASTLAVLRRELAERKRSNKTIAVLADPVFEKNDERVKERATKSEIKTSKQIRTLTGIRNLTLGKAGASLKKASMVDAEIYIPRLPFTRQEAEGILALSPETETVKAFDFEASRAMAISPELSRCRMVHFATHGYLDTERPELSGIILSMVDERGMPQDGFLKTIELYNLNLSADMVVLSACETGLGKQIKGEGLVGLTRGFMYAGAGSVVVSLWCVSDKATAELMVKFYRKMLVEGLRPAAALRAAQIEMWKGTRWKAPFYWAAFIVQGAWQ